jgi:hypothetical protein
MFADIPFGGSGRRIEPEQSGFDLLAWASAIGLLPVAGAPGDLLTLSDQEVTMAIARHGDLYVVEASDRGVARWTRGGFAARADAERQLVADIGLARRTAAGLPTFPLRGLAPGSSLEQGPTAQHLSWSGGSAEFPLGLRGQRAAERFSWLIDAPLADIARSFLDAAARPLADRRTPGAR